MKKRLNKILKWIQDLPILKNILAWSQKYSAPGFSEVPLYDVIRFIYNEAMRDNISTRANSVAFSFFIAIFPFIIFLFTLLPLMPFTADYVVLLKETLAGVLPDNASGYLINMIEGITSIPRKGLLSLGFLLAIFFSSSGMLTLMAGFDKSYALTFKIRSFFKKRLVAIALTLLLSFMLIVSFVLIIVGGVIIQYLDEKLGIGQVNTILLKMLRWVVATALVYFGITFIYRFGPSLRKKIKIINPGAIVASLFSLATSIGFSYFVNNFGRYNEIYGSIGALIVIMIWLQFNAFIILAGFELNASIAVNRDLLLERKED